MSQWLSNFSGALKKPKRMARFGFFYACENSIEMPGTDIFNFIEYTFYGSGSMQNAKKSE
jgi:hypothetical protein